MMVHLYFFDEQPLMFKDIRYVENGHAVAIGSPKEEDPAILYVYPQFVGFFARDRMYKLIPNHRIKEIHLTRKAGESWGT